MTRNQDGRPGRIDLVQFKIGDHVIDRDGRKGTITKVTEWHGSVWYDVRFGQGREGVRYNGDLVAS